MTARREEVQGSVKLTGQQKAAISDDAARKIIAAETIARDKKTEKLRQLRLQKIAAEGEVIEAPVKKKKK